MYGAVKECLGRLKDAACWFRFYVLLGAGCLCEL